MHLIVITNVVNYFLGNDHAAKVASLAKSNDGKALEGCVYEALSKSFARKAVEPSLIFSIQDLIQLSGVSTVGFFCLLALGKMLILNWWYHPGIAS
jgi:hypothetical protein